MKRIRVIIMSFLCTLLLLGCKGKSSSEKEIAIISIISANDVASSSATLTAVINLSSSDISKSEYGFLYVSEDDIPSGMSAESLFNEFSLEGTLSAGNVKYLTSIQAGGIIYTDITKLSQKSKYYYSAYVRTADGTCYLSNVQTFTTTQYNPIVTTGVPSDIYFYSAILNGSVNINTSDLKHSTYGIIISEEPGVVYPGSKVYYHRDSDMNFSFRVTNLKAYNTYYYRTYSTIDGKNYVYGEEKSFTTKSTDDMIVDLGLSVKWASCNIGADIPTESGNYYQWGCLEDSKGYLNKYPHYNPSTSEYLYIGDDISGTEYDAATHLLGEGWRMPTETEILELLNECKINIVTYDDGMLGAELVGPSGNAIIFSSAGEYNEGKYVNIIDIENKFFPINIKSSTMYEGYSYVYYKSYSIFISKGRVSNIDTSINERFKASPIRAVYDGSK